MNGIDSDSYLIEVSFPASVAGTPTFTYAFPESIVPLWFETLQVSLITSAVAASRALALSFTDRAGTVRAFVESPVAQLGALTVSYSFGDYGSVWQGASLLAVQVGVRRAFLGNDFLVLSVFAPQAGDQLTAGNFTYRARPLTRRSPV